MSENILPALRRRLEATNRPALSNSEERALLEVAEAAQAYYLDAEERNGYDGSRQLYEEMGEALARLERGR